MGAIVVFDRSRLQTFEKVKLWKKDIDEKVQLYEMIIPCVLVANKCDLSISCIDPSEMDDYCKKMGFLGWSVVRI